MMEVKGIDEWSEEKHENHATLRESAWREVAREAVENIVALQECVSGLYLLADPNDDVFSIVFPKMLKADGFVHAARKAGLEV